jgi:N-acetylglucosaminyldiphosphoundecaprenol N-acetyl-beta-D-mannosaminyltransferase
MLNSQNGERGAKATPHTDRRPFATQWIGSIEFAVADPRQAVRRIINLALETKATHVHLANAYTTALADKSGSYRAALRAPSLNFPDGKPLGWISRLRRQSPPLHQVRGPQLFLDVFDEGRAHKIRHYLLGSTPQVLEALEQNLVNRFPGVLIVGAESPPFRALTPGELSSQDARILASGAQIVWVGLGTPKQDLEVVRLTENLPVVAVAIGAAFDFTAGTLEEAPGWLSKVGLEWAFRFAKEPKRLWRRYLYGNARFLKAALLPPRGMRPD